MNNDTINTENDPVHTERLYTVKEASERLNILHGTLRQLISEREIGSYRLKHRAIRLSEQHIQEFLRKVEIDAK